ncbi:MAG: PAS domain-containing protein, partial [Acidobacteria bacterium]|nr:PAS domain-containing protein [Acidobacteriota bacterium]
MNSVEAYQSAYGSREESVHIAGGHVKSRFDPGTDPLCLLDTSGAFLDANLAFCEMVGYPTSDLSRMRF